MCGLIDAKQKKVDCEDHVNWWPPCVVVAKKSRGKDGLRRNGGQV